MSISSKQHLTACSGKIAPKLLIGIFSGLAIAFSTAANAGNPGFKTSWSYYSITGATSRELKKQMKQKGPNGYWAYARWYINWEGNCQVDVTINYTMPRWQNKSSAPGKLQDSWDKMIKNLKAHEEIHGSHGISAANAIVANKCKNYHDIITKWANEDKNFDARTGHGRRKGVVLP